MGHRIQFKCSAREVTAEYGESVLAAAIRAGFNVDYGCNSGNCGRCSAWLLEGELRKIRHFDYVPRIAERADRHFLMCSHAAASNLVLDARVGDRAESIPEQQIRAKVRRVADVGKDVRIVTLRMPRSQRLRFLAGQSARLSGAHFARVHCPIASCPCEDTRLEFHVPHSRGDFSDYVFRVCRSGHELDITAPFGNFTFDEDTRRPAVFIAFETGFAPVKSLIEHVTGQEEETPLSLYWITDTGRPYLDNLCRAWHDAFDNFSYTPLAFDAVGGSMEACARRIAAGFPDLSESDVYICAPEKHGDTLARACLDRNLEPERLFREPMCWHDDDGAPSRMHL